MDNKKATFVLPAAMLDEMRTLVEQGLAESASALVRDSLEARLRELREEQLTRHFLDAAQDPEFMADLEASMADFTATDAETARLINP